MSSSQKFIAKNRAPRVQIEYDVELYGAEKKIQLPFVMGVMSDLSGKSEVAQPSIKDRKFLEIDIDNFDSRMKSMKPRAAFAVPNTLSGEGSLSVDLTFEKMSDFSPAAIASKVEPLRKLLEARTQLSNLMTYMDGKTGAEELIERLIEDPAKFKAMALAGASQNSDTDAAFDAMKAAAPEVEEAVEDNSGILDALKADAPAEVDIVDKSADVLADIAAEPEVEEAADTTGDVLADMVDSAVDPVEEVDTSSDILAGMAMDTPDEIVDNSAETALAAMRAVEVDGDEAVDDNSDLLAEMAATAPDHVENPDQSGDILADMAVEIEDQPEDNSADLALEAMRAVELEDIADDSSDDLLADIAADAPEDVAEDDTSSDILADMATGLPDEIEDNTADLAIDAMRAIDVEADPADNNDALLADMASDIPDTEIADDSSDILANLAIELPEEPEDNSADEALAAMRDVDVSNETEDNTDELLADMASVNIIDEPADDSLDVLADIALDAPDEEDATDNTDELFADMALDAPEAEAVDDRDDILNDLAIDIPEAEENAGNDDVLAQIAVDTPDEVEEEDILSGLEFEIEEDEADDKSDDILADIAVDAPEDDVEEDILADITFDEVEPEQEDETDDILAGLDLEFDDVETPDDSDDILADLAEDVPEDDVEEDVLADISFDDVENEEDTADDILAGLDIDLAEDDSVDQETQSADDILAELGLDFGDEPDEDNAEAEVLNDDLAAMLADSGVEFPEGEAEAAIDIAAAPIEDSTEIDLDDLLADEEENFDDLLSDDDELDALLTDDGSDDDLDGLLADDVENDDDLDGLLDEDIGDLDDLLTDNSDDLDDLFGDLDDLPDDSAKPEETLVPKPKKPAFQPNFGSMSAAKMQHEAGSRRKFRIAVLGDFSGRGNKGNLETGADLAKRKGFKLDFDTMEDVIMAFRTTLTLPLGNDGTAVEVELNELDDLHPDELFENVEMFNELNMLRRDLVSGRNLDAAIAKMQGWGSEFGDFRAKSNKRAKGSAAPADLRLTDFQNLIGDKTPTLEASEASDLISRIVGPHIVAAKDTGSEAMIAAVDAALSTAMNSVLHHPDFQTVEAGWRAIELLGRRIEASANLEVVIYDMSVEEFAADLAGAEDMAQTGLYDMLVEKPRMDESGGPFAAVFGLYTWEETPPHAEILARMARICANMDAPFVSAMSTTFMGVKPEDRHKLVQDTWGALRKMPEAKYLGLATPRFLLRMPYGKKTEPVDRFDYEEFNVQDGMRSMLMANPATLVAVLLGETLARQGKDMSLGSIMSLDDMPFHYMIDQYGDQVALPCTERLLNVRTSAEVIARGYMPVISVQGQNMVKLGSFQAVGGGELLGIWAGDSAKQLSAGAQMQTSVGFKSGAEKPATLDVISTPNDAASQGDDLDLEGDDLDLDLDLGGDDDLDDLLAGFGDDDLELGDDDGMDDDLAALLGDL